MIELVTSDGYFLKSPESDSLTLSDAKLKIQKQKQSSEYS